MKKISVMSALKISAAISALMLVPSIAQAADCFDKNTSDPKAGNATAVVGPAVSVQREQMSDLLRPANGADMFAGDQVTTGDESHLQLKLCDWSTYTFSPNSSSQISEFFNADGAGRRRVVNFFRGGFRFASGRNTEPGSTQVEVQDSGVTMGVRGTNVILAELDNCVYALLEGPVRDNNGLTPKGLVDFWTGGNSAAIEATLKRPGYAVCINQSGVGEPFRADSELLRRIYEAFVPVVPENNTPPTDYVGDPLRDSGQETQDGERPQGDFDDQNDQEDDFFDDIPEQPWDDQRFSQGQG